MPEQSHMPETVDLPLNSNVAARLLAMVGSDEAAANSARKVDGILRSSCSGPTLLAAVADYALLTCPSDDKSKVLDALAYRALRASNVRLRRFQPRSLWGVTPIVQLPCCAKADRLLGIEAETLVFTTYYITSDFDINLKQQMDWICENCPEQLAAFQWMVLYWALLTYDIFHFFNDRGLLANVGGYGSDRFGISREEMELLKRSGKQLYTYVYGADHRMREATLAMGKYNFCMACPEIGKFCVCDDVGGKKMLATIGRYANAMIASGRAMTLIPNAHNMFHLIVDLSANKFRAIRSNSNDTPILRIAHAPNHGFFKGTQYLIDAVGRLQVQGVPVELVTLSGVPNEQVLELIASSDVLADQFISGSFGYTAIESMALGVPVMCYLSPDVEFPEREKLPVINCHPEHIEETILQLVEGKASLRALGELSRDYVARNYSVEAFSLRLRGLYLETGHFPVVVREFLRNGTRPPTWKQLILNAATSRHIVYTYLLDRYPRLAGLLVFIRRGKLGKVAVRAATSLARWILSGWAEVILQVAVFAGRHLTRWRSKGGQLRSLWGVTPILTLPLLARCDRLLGLRSESVVLSTYHITSQFDINLGKLLGKVLDDFPIAYPAFQRLSLAWALLRYDVFHYFCDRGFLAPVDFRIGINPVELEILERAGKKLFCYAYGADVRTRDATLALGKYNLCVYCPEPMKYCICDDALGAANIARIAAKATAMVSMGDMLAYVPGARNRHYWPIDLDRFPFVGVNWSAGAPLRIAHVPNHAHFKGTSYLDDAVSRLQEDGFKLEVLRAQGVPNETVIQIYSEADIVADQFVAGFHGYATLEAMALGKPVLCYLRGPEMMLDETECPIINASPDMLYATLRDILEGRVDLVDLGLRARSYIVKYYSCDAVAVRQGEMYRELLAGFPRLDAKLRDRIIELKTGMGLEIRETTA
jgi:glycosyltransferase involved in cell wall biosynthesis